VIETHALTKTFGLRPILRGVNLHVAPGECVALLGPNGAGKTTLIRILSTLARPTLGRVQVAGFPLPAGAAEVRRRLGVVSHHTLLYTDLTAEENLAFYARMYGLAQPAARMAQVLEQVGLTARRRDLVRTFSRGMQQRLSLGRALLPDPQVMLFDEPYTGLDPDASRMLDEVLRAVVGQGRTVLLTTHDLPRAVGLSDRVLILARGRIAFEARSSDLSPASFAETYASIVH
jgi:heme exporter protein A